VAATTGVAVREAPTEAGPADYVLFVETQAVGVIEGRVLDDLDIGDDERAELQDDLRSLTRVWRVVGVW